MAGGSSVRLRLGGSAWCSARRSIGARRLSDVLCRLNGA
jgi:hypothetical protein